MNLRILKKLSKKAAPFLPLLGDHREQFRARIERGDGNFHKAFVGDRKHWERSRCHPSYEGRNSWTRRQGAEIVFSTRAGRRIVISPPDYARKGTIMVGATSGYYEPEWDEECAWVALDTLVRDRFTDFQLLLDEDYEGGVLTRELTTPAQILAAAKEMLTELQAEKR